MTLEPQNSDFPANKHFAITPADTDLAVVPRAIYVGVAGTLVLRDVAGVDVTYTAVAGSIIPFRAIRVGAASTATGIIGLY